MENQRADRAKKSELRDDRTGRDKRCWGLLRRRQCLVPTWRGWLLMILGLTLLTIVSFRTIHPFLAMNQPEPGGVLVVEGWAPEYVLQAAIAEFNRDHYSKLFVTGGPMDRGSPLWGFKNWADLGAASLLTMGMTTNSVQAVPAPLVPQDRTFAAAVTLKDWLRERGSLPTKINVVTLGPHARRSRLLFERAFGKGVAVGVIAVEPEDYDPRRWWRSSYGVRAVLSETLGYVYVRVFFHG